MRALVKRTDEPVLSLEDAPAPVPGPDEVLIRVAAVGICGTDLHILHGEYAHALPLIPGHEFAGELVELGGEVNGPWKPGDRVVGELHTGACRRCEICLSGNPQICPHKRAYGTWRDGAFAELLSLPAWLLHRIPDGLSDEEATLFEPTACSIHGLWQRGRFEPGDSVLVVGHGPIGLLCAQAARASGASQVIVSGTSRKGTARLDMARRLGFEVIDVEREELEERLGELTGGRGVDIAVESAGTETALAQAIGAARRGGRVAVLGLSGRRSVSFPWDTALVNDLDVIFSFSSNHSSWRRTIDLAAAGRLELKGMITHRLPLDRWAEGVGAIEAGEAVKVVLEL